jgi:hypothetical protein
VKAAGQTRGWLLPLVLGLVVAASPLSARGVRDTGLARADKLIADRQYDEAIRLLAGYAGENPGEFAEAQKRLRRIILLRDDYNALAGDLLDQLTADSDDPEKLLDLTRQLEAIEPAQGMVRQFISQVEALAVFGYNRQLLEQIMVEARALLDRGDYAAAMERYADGLDLYREEFFSGDYDRSVKDRVLLYLNSLRAGIEELVLLVAPFKAALAGLDQTTFVGDKHSVARLQDFYARLSLPMERLIAAENAMAVAGNYFDEQLARFRREDPGLGDRNYLAFASRVVRGRWNADAQEGLLGAVAQFWASALSPFEAGLTRASELAYRDAQAAQESRNLPLARERFELAAACCALAERYFGDWLRFYQGQNVQTHTFFGDTVVDFKARDYLRYYSMSLAAASQIEAGPLLEQHDRLASVDSTALEAWEQGRMDAPAAIAREREERSACRDLAGKVEAALEGLNTGGWAILQHRYELAGERIHFTSMESALALLAGLDANIFILENNAAIREYTIANRELQMRVVQWKRQFANGNRFLTGIPLPGEDEAHAARYPREALELFVRVDQGSLQGLEDGRALVARYEGELPRFFQDPRIAMLYNGARGMVEELEELRANTLSLAQSARSQADRAEILEAEANRLYQEAQTSMAQGNFDMARDRAIRSGERYDMSLAIQESIGVRHRRDSDLIALGAEITRLENEAVVRELRGLVNSARDTYFQGDFEAAEGYLVRGMNLWRRVSLEDDPELSYWLTVVRGAMSLRAGRVIPPTAPLYPEMSQLLSDARKNYDDGMALINANRRPEGMGRFAEARRKTREVRLMFPVNQEASLLDLRMDQVLDPEAFNASFQRRLNDAIAGVRQRSVESFAELQNLSDLNPNFPGIRGMVVQAEIDMGYRPAPPNPQALARSGELTASARGILDRNVRSQFPAALEQLNQALTLNPSNSQAMSLKDRVQTELGGGGSVVLNSAAEREYQRAVQALQQGNTLVAMTIVRQLLQQSENRNSRRILDLQRRIESIL